MALSIEQTGRAEPIGPSEYLREPFARRELAELPAPLVDFDRGPDGEDLAARERHGVRAALASGPFRLLWLAEFLTQTAQNALWYAALVLVERATASTTLLSLTIVSAVLPAALFGMLAGILVDRWPNRGTLLACNLLRALVVPLYLLHDELVLLVLVANFAINTVAQFYYPAQLAAVPRFLPREQLTAAMGLFNLTWTLAQLFGLILLGPLVLKSFGPEAGPAAIVALAALSYLVAAAGMLFLPRGGSTGEAPVAEVDPEVTARHAHPVASIWHDLRDGVRCIHHNGPARLAILYVALTTTLMLVIATLAPRFAVSELGIAATDAVFLIAPAGAAMALASSVAHRLTRLFRRERLVERGLLFMVAALLALAAVGPTDRWLLGRGLLHPVEVRGWHILASQLGVVMLLAAVVGWQVGMVMVPAQAIVAEWAPEELRGRIFAIQLTLTNLASIVPLLALGGLADLIGIPAVLGLLALGVLGLWYLTLRNPDALVLHPTGNRHAC
jgi:MFS family permease